jgi:hypothetical protein
MLGRGVVTIDWDISTEVLEEKMKANPLNKVRSYALRKKLRSVFQENREKQRGYQSRPLINHCAQGGLKRSG